jgi:ATP-binding cassette subfamily B protein
MGPWRALWRSCLLVGRLAPGDLGRLAVLNLAIGASPVVLLLLGKIVIDGTARRAAEGRPDGAPSWILADWAILAGVVGFVAINVLIDAVETLGILGTATLRDRVLGAVRGLIYDKIANFEDIALFESPDLLNTAQLAEQAIPKLQRLAQTVSNLMIGVFAFVPALVLSFSITWWVPLAIFLSAAPSCWAQLRYERMGWDVEETQAGLVRQMGVHGRVLTDPEFAQELRLLGLQSYLLARWRGLFRTAFDEMRTVRRRGAFVVLGWSVLSGLGAGQPYVYVVAATAVNRYSLGDLALYAGLAFQVRRSLFTLIYNTAELHGIAIGSAAVFRLLDLRSTLGDSAAGVDASDAAITVGTDHPGDGQGLEVRGLSFSYPGSDRPVLKDLNLRIGPRETVVVVGENGAGKTTLAKLLCRFYDPQEGVISWDGRDIRSFGLDAWRRNIVVVNQDYARFPATARENIGFGRLAQIDDHAQVAGAADGAALGAVIDRLPSGLDTPLSRQIEGGVELSGGQWQRVAIARALMRSPRSRLLILDEPTAALDARTEHELFDTLRRMAEDKIAVVISHRLALARTADRILVMEHGSIVEAGTHAELMDARGRYFGMFTRQASSYVEAASDGEHVRGPERGA